MVSTTSRLAALITLLLPLASASAPFSFNSTVFQIGGDTSSNGTETTYEVQASIPASVGLSAACAAAYSRTINCDTSLVTGGGNSDDPEAFKKSLETICTADCIDTLREWRDAIQDDCTAEDIQKANATRIDESSAQEGVTLLIQVSQKDYPVIESMYWPFCTRDLTTNDLCTYEDADWLTGNTTSLSTEEVATFCNNTCLTQYSAYTYSISARTSEIDGYEYNPEEYVVNVSSLCPNVDISKYPVLLSLKPTDEYMFGGAGNDTVGTNAAGAVRASVVGSAIIAVFVVALAMF